VKHVNPASGEETLRLEGRETSAEDCGCAPTPGEQRALWPALVNRRTALSIGALGVAGVALLGAPSLPAAYAADYPSWDDVQRAKKNEASKAAEIKRIEGLIASLAENVRRTQEIADQRAEEL